MFNQRRLVVVIAILSLFLQAQGADKYTDENRPYEFGFKIDGPDGEKEQHRHEKKDERGLIEGEYGFITADGVYHVTVYATDENGNFKILSMKNIRVRPYPGTEKAKKGHSIPFPPSQQAPIIQGPVHTQQNAIAQAPSLPAKTCSSCSIPSTTKAPPVQPQLTDIASVSRDPAYNSVQYPENTQQNYPGQNYPGQNYPQQPGPQEQYPQQQNPQEQYPQQQYPQQENSQQGVNQDYPAGVPNQENYSQPGQELSPPQGGTPQYPGQTLQPGHRNPKQFDFPPPQQVPDKPQLVYAQMQIVDRNTDIHHRGPGEKEGLPNGLTKQDMKQLLYTFNYTVAFHGHHEEGYTDGSKVGYYFVTGRNGVRTRIDYVADENGFRPKISQEVLDLLSEDVPKEETERDEKYGLKGYEFKWLYYPVDSKRR